jgi:predicted nucleic acid-binding protein
MNDIFVDSDIILDLLLKREPFHTSAAILFSAIEKGTIKAYTSPIVITNIYYISAKIKGKSTALDNIKKILSLLKITTVDEKTMLLGIGSDFSDFEDAIQYFSAKSHGINCLITRNKSDYRIADITISTAEEYMKTHIDHSI